MFLSNFSIKQPVTTVVIVIMLMCMGLIALKNLRVNQMPDVEQPVIVVNVPYPGASPETVEREIINRVEKALQSIPQVYEIRSTANESNANIVIVFNFKKNMVEASDEIRNAIARCATNCRWKCANRSCGVSILPRNPSCSWHCRHARSRMRRYPALQKTLLADRFRAIDGVSIVNVNGALRRELSVLLRAEKLREYNVSVTEVVAALATEHHRTRWARQRLA